MGILHADALVLVLPIRNIRFVGGDPRDRWPRAVPCAISATLTGRPQSPSVDVDLTVSLVFHEAALHALEAAHSDILPSLELHRNPTSGQDGEKDHPPLRKWLCRNLRVTVKMSPAAGSCIQARTPGVD